MPDQILNKLKLFHCDCGGEAIGVYKDDEFPQLELSFWSYGQEAGMSFLRRLKYCWQILYKGKPYGDMVVMDTCTAKLFAEHVIKLVEAI